MDLAKPEKRSVIAHFDSDFMTFGDEFVSEFDEIEPFDPGAHQTCQYSIFEEKDEKILYLSCGFPFANHNFPVSALEKSPYTTVSINCKQFDHAHLPFIKQFNFQRLCLYKICDTDYVMAMNPRISEKHHPKVNISQLLDEMVNDSNRDDIYHFTFNGRGLSFEENWPKKVAEKFASVMSLNLYKYQYLNRDFGEICSHFPKLTSLDISHCYLPTLNGISSLTNLETLIFHNSSFEKVEQIQDLFKLEKLKKLDFWAKPNFECSFAQLYADADSVLMNLEVLVITRNVVRIESVSKIVESHPKLKWVHASYITHPKNCNEQIVKYIDKLDNVILDFESPRLLLEVFNSYKYFDPHFAFATLKNLKPEIFFSHYLKYPQTIHVYRKFIRKSLYEFISYDPIRRLLSERFAEFYSDSFWSRLTNIEQSFMVKTLINTLAGEQNDSVAASAWSSIHKEFIIDCTVEERRELHELALVYMTKENFGTYASIGFEKMLILQEDMSENAKEFMFQNDTFKKNVLSLIGKEKFCKTEQSAPLIKFICYLCHDSPQLDQRFMWRCIGKFLEEMNYVSLSENSPASKYLKTLESLLEKMDQKYIEYMFENKKKMRIIIECFTCGVVEVQKSAASLLIFLFLQIDKSWSKVKSHELPKTIDAFVSFVNGYQENRHTRGYESLLAASSKDGSVDCIEATQWLPIFQTFVDETLSDYI